MLTLKSKTKTAENPFYGKRAMLDMFQDVSKMGDNPSEKSVFSYLDKAFLEVGVENTARELFYVMLFAFGDIANREHNLFIREMGKNKAQAGGESLRKVFVYGLKWLLQKNPKQFYNFLPIIGEYTNLENLFFYQLRTDRNTGKLLEEISIIPTKAEAKQEFLENVTDYLANLIKNVKTNDVTHALLSKFIKAPKYSKRVNKYVRKNGEIKIKRRSLKSHTIEKENFEKEFVTLLSKKCSWEITEYPNNVRFTGLQEYKAKYNRLSEAYMFSSKEILKFDKEQFAKWLDKLPAGSRFRVQCRLFNKEGNKLVSTKKWVGQYGDLADFYNEWLSQKEKSNEVVRVLEEKAKTNSAGLTEGEKVTLAKATKDAKVNTGAETMMDLLAKFFKGGNRAEMDVIADNILRKVDIQVPVLVVADISGSMSSNYVTHKGVKFRAMDMARLVSTIFLTKNPDPEMADMLVTFDDTAKVLVAGNKAITKGNNRFMQGREVEVKTLVDRTKTFTQNYDNISQYVYSGGSTRITAVSEELKNWVDSAPSNEREGRKEMINRYPVWLVVSDGDINNDYNATKSIQKFMMDMKQYFGWNGVLVIWDVKDNTSSQEKNKFEGIENVMYFGKCNPQVLNQVFQNIHDLDVIDIYTPLKALYSSNRYQAVKNLIIH